MMRRKDREVLSKEWMEEVIQEALYMELAMSDDGEPYVIPLNYGYSDGRFYVHGAMAGRKVDALRKNPRVAFNVLSGVQIVPRPRKPGKLWCVYRSVCGTGTVRFLTDLEEKRRAVAVLKDHYSDGNVDYMSRDEAMKKVVNVFVVDVEEMTGKTKGYPNPSNPAAPLFEEPGQRAGAPLEGSEQ